MILMPFREREIVDLAQRRVLWLRSFAISCVLMVLWSATSYFLFGSMVFVWLIFGSFGLISSSVALEKNGYITESQGFYCHSMAYFFAVYICVIFTGGLNSPMMIGFWVVANVAMQSAPHLERSMLPIVLLLFSGYISLYLQETHFSNPNLVRLLYFCVVTISTTSKGNLFRRVIRSSIIKEQELNEAKSRFLATVSHELRTPLTTIIGWTDVLLSSEKPASDYKDNLETIKLSATQMHMLINDILDYAKIEQGKLTFESIPFNMEKLVQRMIDSSKILVKSSVKLVSKISLPETLKTVVGDPDRISQCLNNFMSNAAKFTSQGEITLSCSLIETRSSGDGSESVKIGFEVTDTGIGMSEETVRKLFQPFFQADSATTRKFGGTGLGLSITKQLVDHMSGSIKVRSTPGVGSTFSWDIWLDSSSEAPQSPAVNLFVGTAALDSVNRKANILLAEDNALNQRLLRHMLQKLEFPNVDIAATGEEVLALMNDKHYDLVFMDIHMPVLDGLGATEYIRQLGNKIPIVGLTANADAETIAQGHNVGMNELISKPIHIPTLSNVLAKYLQ